LPSSLRLRHAEIKERRGQQEIVLEAAQFDLSYGMPAQAIVAGIRNGAIAFAMRSRGPDPTFRIFAAVG
jgi:hypothetical protein